MFLLHWESISHSIFPLCVFYCFFFYCLCLFYAPVSVSMVCVKCCKSFLSLLLAVSLFLSICLCGIAFHTLYFLASTDLRALRIDRVAVVGVVLDQPRRRPSPCAARYVSTSVKMLDASLWEQADFNVSSDFSYPVKSLILTKIVKVILTKS